MLGPVCPWTAVPATTHINAATALANQAHFAAAENTGPRLPVCLLPHQIITTQPTRLARPHRRLESACPPISGRSLGVVIPAKARVKESTMG
jgi:hypothetical protein